MTNLDAASHASSSSSPRRIRRRRSIILLSSYLTMCVILALSFISVLISLLSFSGVRATVTILNRGVTTTTVINTPTGDQLSLTKNSNGVAAARSNAISITTAATKRSVGNSTSGGSSSINNSATDDDGMIELNTVEFDNELRRMVEERRKDGTRRGKIAWLMSFPNSGTSFTSLLIRLASNTTSGTNYGMETNPGANAMSIPIYNWSEFGPYWIHPPGSGSLLSSSSSSSTNGAATATLSVDNRCKNKTLCITRKKKKVGDSSRRYDVPPTTASIITKTHCGTRCVFCPPQEYLETEYTFLGSCLSGSRKVPSRIRHGTDVDRDALKKAFENGTLLHYLSHHVPSSTTTTSLVQYKRQRVMYDPRVVERAIHLIRDPFDNLVSRFHHEQKENPKRGKERWVTRYSNDVTGFKRWCTDEDTISECTNDERRANWTKYGYPANIATHFRGVSCHAEFFRYVHWHLMSIRVVEMLDIPVLYVHYEDYKLYNVSNVTDRMLDFLTLDRVGMKLPTFHTNKDYSEYFTNEERASASDLMRRLVASKGMDGDRGRMLLERYWVDLDVEKLSAQTGSIE